MSAAVLQPAVGRRITRAIASTDRATMTTVIAYFLLAAHTAIRRHPKGHAAVIWLVNRTVAERRVLGAVLAAAQPDDCAWDVGANIGTYTREFLDRVGPAGRVVAFEPVPTNFELLSSLESPPRLVVFAGALGDAGGTARLAVSGRNGETSRIGGSGDGEFDVRVERGDSLLRELPRPDVIKIDVEGMEGDVLDGMLDALRTARTVIIEVHFAAMADRGRPRDVLRILHLLRGLRFEVRWIDSSHLMGVKAT